MIVQCNNCHKKFDLDANLIPEEGRLLQCSACNNTWFFKKKKIETPQEVAIPEIQNNKEEETISPKRDHTSSSEKSSNNEIENIDKYIEYGNNSIILALINLLGIIIGIASGRYVFRNIIL